MIRTIQFRIFTAFAIFIWSTLGYGFTYGPFAGFSGYQEYEVGDGVYFVAFHIHRNENADGLDLAWQTRAAEICSARNSSYFVELQYSFESVMVDQKSGQLEHESYGWNGAERYIKVAGFIYIPIFVPSFGGGGGLIDSPSKQAHIRCINRAEDVKDSSRLVEASKVLAEAKTKKWFKRQ